MHRPRSSAGAIGRGTRKDELHALYADLLLVQAHWQAEEIDEAVSVLERGLSFALERGIVQPFVDEGPALARILYRARTLGLDHPFIGKLLAAFPLDQQSTAAAETQPQSVEPLSAREVKVLTLLSQGLSNKEVAAEIHLSDRTVRWYASTIYAKLGVSSRTQAIAKGSAAGDSSSARALSLPASRFRLPQKTWPSTRQLTGAGSSAAASCLAVEESDE